MQVRQLLPFLMLAIGAAAGLPAGASEPERDVPLQVTRLEDPAAGPAATSARVSAIELRDVIVRGERMTVRAYRGAGERRTFLVDSKALGGPLHGRFELAGPAIRFHDLEGATMRSLDVRKGEVRKDGRLVGKLVNLPRRQTASYWLEPEALAALTGDRLDRAADGALVFEPVPADEQVPASQTAFAPQTSLPEPPPRSGAPVPVKRRGKYQRVAYTPANPGMLTSDAAAPVRPEVGRAIPQWRPAAALPAAAVNGVFDARVADTGGPVPGDWREAPSWQVEPDRVMLAPSRRRDSAEGRPELFQASFDVSSPPAAVRAMPRAPAEPEAGADHDVVRSVAAITKPVVSIEPDWPALEEARQVSHFLSRSSVDDAEASPREISAFNPARRSVPEDARQLANGLLSKASLEAATERDKAPRLKPRSALSAVSGTLFIDRYGDGAAGPGDQRLEGETLVLVNDWTGKAVEARTAAFGQFAFADLPPGTYRLRVMIGWQECSVPVSVERGQGRAAVSLAIPPDVFTGEPGAATAFVSNPKKKPG